MKKISIRSGARESEREFARMLFLELSEKGFEPVVGKSADAAAEILVWDQIGPEEAEELTEEISPSGPPLLLCVREINERIPEAVVCFERPFDIGRFLDYLKALMEGGKRELPSGNFGDRLLLDSVGQYAVFRGVRVALTGREYALLRFLDEKRGEAISRAELLRGIWNRDDETSENTVDVYIRHLRKKLDERFDTRFLITVRGKGYLLR